MPSSDEGIAGYPADDWDAAKDFRLDLACPSVRLWYSWVWTSIQQQESADYRVRLTATRPRFGGLRWWFVCLLIVNGRPCNRRVGKFHLPPRGL
jgi:hypothetical protein